MATFTESFNKADSTTLGPDQTWVEDFGDLQIVGNAVRAVSAASRSWARTAAQTATTHKRAKVTVKTFATPTSGTNEIQVMWTLVSAAATTYGARIVVDSSGVCTVAHIYNGTGPGAAVTNLNTPFTITKPSTPFTFEVVAGAGSAGEPYTILVNGVPVGNPAGVTMGAGAGAGFAIYAQNTVSEVEIDSFETSTDNILPTGLTLNFSWPSDGISYIGPFISSAGNIYTVGRDTGGNSINIFKSTDPTSSFAPIDNSFPGFSGGSGATTLSVQQVGDVLHVVSGGGGATTTYWYRAWNMATDAWVAAALNIAGTVAPLNGVATIVKRSTGGDVIAFYNTASVSNMGKSWGRVAARRSVSGTGAFGTQTIIGIDPVATTLQTESVEGALLGASDRVHLFWNRTSTTVGISNEFQRTVKSTDNLGGTQPATAAQGWGGNSASGATADLPVSLSGPAFISAGGVIAIPTMSSSTTMQLATATDADTPTWSFSSSITSATPIMSAFGATAVVARLGGAPFDGTNKYVTWINNAFDPTYDKDTGSGFGTDIVIGTTSSTFICSNIFQRGSNIVLASVYDLSTGVWVYDEVVLRTTGPSGPITPVTLTLTPIALVAAGTGDANRTLTNATLTLTPVALVRGTDTVTRSISPVTITLTPVTLTGQVTILDQPTSISPAIFTLTPIALVRSIGDVNRTLTSATFTLTPIALTRATDTVALTLGIATVTFTPIALVRSVGGISTTISPVTITLTAIAITRGTDTSATSITFATFTLTPIALTTSVGTASQTLGIAIFTLTPVALTSAIAQSTTLGIATFTLTPIALTTSVGSTFASISPVIMTFTPIVLVRSVGGIFTTISPTLMTLTPIALAKSVGDANRTLTPTQFVLTPIALTTSVGPITSSIAPATFTLTAIALTKTVGTITVAVSPAIFTLTPIALTRSVGGTAASSISPVTFTLTAITITGFSATPGTGNILPAIFTLSPIALTRSVGGVSSSITQVTMTLTPIALTRGTDTSSRTITPVAFVFTAVALTRGTDNVARTLTPTQFVLSPVALAYSVGAISRSLTSVIFTLTPVALTRSIGTVNLTVAPVEMTFTAITLTYSIGTTSRVLSPAILTLIAVILIPSGFGGRPYVWIDSVWTEKPVKYWTGSVWIAKPMKVWTGSQWELV